MPDLTREPEVWSTAEKRINIVFCISSDIAVRYRNASAWRVSAQDLSQLTSCVHAKAGFAQSKQTRRDAPTTRAKQNVADTSKVWMNVETARSET
jgi:hypothetical protein